MYACVRMIYIHAKVPEQKRYPGVYINTFSTTLGYSSNLNICNKYALCELDLIKRNTWYLILTGVVLVVIVLDAYVDCSSVSTCNHRYENIQHLHI